MQRTGLQWLAIPLVVLGAFEYGARRNFTSVPEWYSAAEVDAAKNHIDFIFVGTSRVASAVNVQIFETEMRLRTKARVKALNLGRGFSTLTEHYLGLRNLLAEYPDQVRGCTVFLEAESGLSLPVRWRDPWASLEQPQLLVPLLRWRDLWGLAQSDSSRDQKLTIVTRFLVGWSTLVAHRERIREQILARGRDWLDGMFPTMAAGPPARGAIDLSEIGGIRTDSNAADEVRQLAISNAKKRLEDQAPASGWEDSIQADLVALLKTNGAALVFFETPESSIFAVGYATEARRRDRASFAEQVEKWGTFILKPRFTIDDADFPDMWHLKRSRSVVFTDGLLAVWLARTGRTDSNLRLP